jgi:hypothetical protein
LPATESLGKIAPNGSSRYFRLGQVSLLDAGSSSMTVGPDGSVWFALNGGIDRMAPDGTLTRFAPAPSFLDTMATSPHGTLWAESSDRGQVERITPAGVVSSFTGPRLNVPMLSATPDGTLWGVEHTSAGATGDGFPVGPVLAIGTDGSVTPVPGLSAKAVYASPDGALWVDEGDGRIGRIAPGALSAPVPSAVPAPMSTPSLVRGQTYSGIVASFVAAPGSPGGFTATIDWGSGAATPGTVTPNGSGGFDVSGTSPGGVSPAINEGFTGGSYSAVPITVTVTDAAGHSSLIENVIPVPGGSSLGPGPGAPGGGLPMRIIGRTPAPHAMAVTHPRGVSRKLRATSGAQLRSAWSEATRQEMQRSSSFWRHPGKWLDPFAYI